MRDITKSFKTLLASEEFSRRLDSYTRVLETPDWKFLRDVFLTIKGEMMVDMLSDRYTNLNKEEKDITQKTYYQINKLLDFLSEPKTWVKEKTFKQTQYDQTGKDKIPSRKEVKNDR